MGTRYIHGTHATVCTIVACSFEMSHSLLCMVKYVRVTLEWDAINLPGSFLVLNDAFVIIDLEMETVDGVMATLMPIGPSHG